MSIPYPTGNPLVDALIALLVLPFVLKALYWTAEKVKGEAKKAQSPPLPDIPKMWERLDAQARQIQDLQAEAFDQRSQANEQAGELFRLGQRVRELEISEGRLIRWTLKIREGILDGLIPPYPPEPDWLLRHIENEGDGPAK